MEDNEIFWVCLGTFPFPSLGGGIGLLQGKNKHVCLEFQQVDGEGWQQMGLRAYWRLVFTLSLEDKVASTVQEVMKGLEKESTTWV